MLRKLMKHEFRATGRIMLPLFGLLLVTAVGANLSISRMMESESSLLSIIGTLLVIGFVIAMAAVCLVSFALMVRRFYSNLLRDEGYLMMTLPVSIHQQLWSKLLVSTVWFAATVLVVILACCIMTFDIRFANELWSSIGSLLRLIIEYNHLSGVLNGVLYCVEFVILCLCGSFAVCLRFYSAMAVGFSFPNHKAVYSVLSYIVIEIVTDLLGNLGIFTINDSWLHRAILGWTDGISAAAGLHMGMWLLIVATAALSTVFYILTVYFLQKRLNLE